MVRPTLPGASVAPTTATDFGASIVSALADAPGKDHGPVRLLDVSFLTSGAGQCVYARALVPDGIGGARPSGADRFLKADNQRRGQRYGEHTQPAAGSTERWKRFVHERHVGERDLRDDHRGHACEQPAVRECAERPRGTDKRAALKESKC